MREYPGFNPTANALNYTLSVVAVVGFLVSGLGIPPANPFVAYFGSIVALLALYAILFFRVIASLLHSSVSTAEN